MTLAMGMGAHAQAAPDKTGKVDLATPFSRDGTKTTTTNANYFDNTHTGNAVIPTYT